MTLTERKKCPVCHNASTDVIYSIDYASPEMQGYLHSFYGKQGHPDPGALKGEVFVLKKCEDCGMVFQSNIPDEESLHELYSRWISHDKVLEMHVTKRSLSSYDHHYTVLRSLIDYFGKRDFKVFDYGFGYAELLRQALLLGIRSYGMELNVRQSALASDAGVNIVDFNSGMEIPAMDVIFCEQVLEHLTEPREILTNIVKISKKGTLLHLSVPNSYNVENVLRKVDWSNMKGNENSVNIFAPLEHINSFRHEQLVRLAGEFGFEPFKLPMHMRLVRRFEDNKRAAKILLMENSNFLKRLLSSRRKQNRTEGFFIYKGG
jgi:SAM-dependent methyltransferase